jgi:pimeloyl-ACP methyl ester carboxylesterase
MKGRCGVPEVVLPAGTIEYQDTGGEGPVLVLLHGLIMDGSVWRNVVAELRDEHRCVLPTLPLGSHRRPMRAAADLGVVAQAHLVADFLDALDLREVTLVLNDWGGAQLVISEGRADRIARMALCSCEAFDNYPPGLPGRMAGLAAKLPGGMLVALLALRVSRLRRLPLLHGWMSKRPVPEEVMRAWLAPGLHSRGVRRDLHKYAGSARDARRQSLAATELLRSFDRPVLVAWASEDRVMPREHGPRLAALYPRGRLVEIADSYTLIPEDQPVVLAHHLREFVANSPG